MAKMVNKARLTWIEGLQFVGLAESSGAAMVLDGDPELGGLGSAVRPTEALLLALGGCMAMDVISVLRKKRQHVTGFHVEAQGTRADEHPRRYETIALEFVVRGWDVSEQALERAIELSHTKYCSVTASLNAEVSVTYRIEHETPPA
jgi:putative redox protein